jgi:hypothetical protein
MPDHHHPEVPMDDRPTPAQQRYLRQLAQRTDRTCVAPRTRAEASRQIKFPKAQPTAERLSREDELANRS